MALSKHLLNKMSTQLSILVDMMYIELGLIPYSMINTEEDDGSIDRILASLSPEDRRKTTRKFRKLARAKCRKWSKTNKMARRILVFNEIWIKLMSPQEEDSL
jgi:hypothetical protein